MLRIVKLLAGQKGKWGPLVLNLHDYDFLNYATQLKGLLLLLTLWLPEWIIESCETILKWFYPSFLWFFFSALLASLFHTKTRFISIFVYFNLLLFWSGPRPAPTSAALLVLIWFLNTIKVLEKGYFTSWYVKPYSKRLRVSFHLLSPTDQTKRLLTGKKTSFIKYICNFILLNHI